MGVLGLSLRGIGAGMVVLAGVILAGVILAGGCSQRIPHSDRPWAQVHVTVTAGGQPVGVGEVTLVAKPESTGVDAGGWLDTRGSVVIPALPGRYVAIILPLPPAEPGGAAGKSDAPRIAPRYRSAATSPFDVEIRTGERNVFTFEMEPAAPASR
jgi:hypothetical protein